MNIENFRNNDAVNMKPPEGSMPEKVRQKWNFIRKGKIGDWQQHFSCEAKLNEFNAWIEKNNKDTTGKPISGI